LNNSGYGAYVRLHADGLLGHVFHAAGNLKKETLMNRSAQVFGQFLLAVHEAEGQWPERRQHVWTYDPNAVAIEYAAATKLSVSISLYGDPVQYQTAGLNGLNLRDGRPGWSRITLTAVTDVALALQFVREAFRSKRRALTPVIAPPAP